MLVIHLSYHCCIRVVKESIAMMGAGVSCHHLQERIANQEAKGYLRSMEFYQTPRHLSAKLRLNDCDLIHVHNEPDWLVYVARLAKPDTPIVYDCHDLDSQRLGQASTDEIKAMRTADAYIFPSKSYLDGATYYHGLDAGVHADKPREVIYSMCLQDHIVRKPLARVGGVVYQGGVTVFEEGSEPKFQYRDYRSFAWEMARLKIPFTLYGVTSRFQQDYVETGAIVFNSIPYSVMLQQLSRYDWGLVGCPTPHPQWDMAMPNKLFEYMAAGIPIVVHNAAECEAFVKKHEVGIVLNDLKHADEVLLDTDLRDRCREAVMDLRGQFTMESQVPKILGVYDRVMSARREGVAA